MGSINVSQAINPPVAKSNVQTFSDAKVTEDTAAQSGTVDTANKTDFRSLITNSMDEVKKARKAKESGDLSTGTDAEFLEKLADQTKEKRVPKNELGKDDFLKLFVTQLQNQDPMNPDDGTEMAAKLAQFNGLEQMMNVNKGLEKLLAAQTSQGNLDKINYIGKEVTLDGGRIRMQNGKSGPANFTVESSIAAGTLEVRDGAGILVSQSDLPRMDRGTHPVQWNGKNSAGRTLPDGTYTFSISARNMDGDPIPVQITSKARITGVDVKDKDGALFSDFGKITMDQIRSVGRPGFDMDAEKAASAALSTTDHLDRMMAEGKMDLKGPANAQGQAPNAAAAPQPAGADAAAAAAANPPKLNPKQKPADSQAQAPDAQAAGNTPQNSANAAAPARSGATAQADADESGNKTGEGSQDLAASNQSASQAKKSVDPKPSPSGKLKDNEQNPSNT